jgi:excisionase family DNA binding protein
MEKLLKPEEAAEALGLRLSTVYKFSMSGKLPATKIGGALRFIDAHTKKVIMK